MIFDSKTFLNDYNIKYYEYGKNWQPGWIQITCPICDDTSNHGGFNVASGKYNCWRCGTHPIETIIKHLLNVQSNQAIKIKNEYTKIINKQINKQVKTVKTICKLPENCNNLSEYHKKYLINRNFDPSEIIDKWHIKGTGPIGEYKFRIIIPILLNEVIVSYQARDTTNKQKLRYKACKIKNEVIHHKHIVYGIDHVKNRKCIITEGITDVWRLGFGAIALFGVNWTTEQLIFLQKNIDCGIILFDSDATIKGEKLTHELNILGLNFKQIKLKKGDPAELTKEEAKNIINKLKYL